LGDKGAYAWQCRLPASEGIVVATIDYRCGRSIHSPRCAGRACMPASPASIRRISSCSAIPPGAQIALYVAAVGRTVAGNDAASLRLVEQRSRLGHNVAAHGHDGESVTGAARPLGDLIAAPILRATFGPNPPLARTRQFLHNGNRAGRLSIRDHNFI